MNLFYALNEGYNILKPNQKNSYKIDAELLLCESLKISREKLILNLDQKISILNFNNFLSKIKRRKDTQTKIKENKINTTTLQIERNNVTGI